jgi:hypothetical protein
MFRRLRPASFRPQGSQIVKDKRSGGVNYSVDEYRQRSDKRIAPMWKIHDTPHSGIANPHTDRLWSVFSDLFFVVRRSNVKKHTKG